MRILTMTLILTAAAGPSLDGQRLPPPLVSPTYAQQATRPDSAAPSDIGMSLGGVLGVFGGIFAGGIAGGLTQGGLEHGCRGEDGCLGGVLLGALVGEPAGVALGVHLANGSKGNYGSEFLASAAILAGGLLLTSAVDGQHGGCGDCGTYIIFIGVPVVQIAASISIEKATSRREQ